MVHAAKKAQEEGVAFKRFTQGHASGSCDGQGR
jgi:hypothetical protein